LGIRGTVKLRRLHNEGLYDQYSSQHIIRVMKVRRMRWVGRVVRVGRQEGCMQSFMGTADGKRPLGRTRFRLDNNIKMDLQEVGWAGMDWIDLAEEKGRCQAFENVLMNLRFP
jgi:histone acetyltransferase (RNA polymerase elongator complex component)